MGSMLAVASVSTVHAQNNTSQQNRVAKPAQHIGAKISKPKAMTINIKPDEKYETKNGKWACRFSGGTYTDFGENGYRCIKSAGRKMIEPEIVENDIEKDPYGRRKRIRECNEAGGQYTEWPSGSFMCLIRTEAEAGIRGRRWRNRCFKRGGIVSNGDFCLLKLATRVD